MAATIVDRDTISRQFPSIAFYLIVKFLARLCTACCPGLVGIGLFRFTRQRRFNRQDDDAGVFTAPQQRLQCIDYSLATVVINQHAQYPASVFTFRAIPEIRDLMLFRNSGQGIQMAGIGNDLYNPHVTSSMTFIV
jgi:hypothetical protein